jgi:hypothetical protein
MPRPADSRTDCAAPSPDVRRADDASVAWFLRRMEVELAVWPRSGSAAAWRLAEFGAWCRGIERRRIERPAP